MADQGSVLSVDTLAIQGHVEAKIPIPDLPKLWQKPSAYVISAVNRKFKDCGEYLHAVGHDSFVAFIAEDQKTRDAIYKFATSIIDKMSAPPSWDFKLHLSGIGFLNKDQITQLLTPLGGNLTSLTLSGGFCEHYGHAAEACIKHHRDWNPPAGLKLKYQAFGHHLEASVTVHNRPTPAPKVGAGARGAEAKESKIVVEKAGVAEACRDFRRGKCNREKCIFSHEQGRNPQPQQQPAATTATGAGAGAGAGGPDGKAGSFNSSSASSSSGNACTTSLSTTRNRRVRAGSEGKVLEPCRDFGRGRCARAVCMFAHAEAGAAGAAHAGARADPDAAASANNSASRDVGSRASSSVSGNAAGHASGSGASHAGSSKSSAANSNSGSAASSLSGSAASRSDSATSSDDWQTGPASVRTSRKRARRSKQSPKQPQSSTVQDELIKIVPMDDDYLGESSPSSTSTSPATSPRSSRTSSPTPAKSEDLAEASSRQ